MSLCIYVLIFRLSILILILSIWYYILSILSILILQYWLFSEFPRIHAGDRVPDTWLRHRKNGGIPRAVSILKWSNFGWSGGSHILGIRICIYIYIYIVYIYTAYIHAYMHTCMHTCIHASMHAYMHTCIHAYIHAHMHTCIHAYMHTCIQAFIHPYITLHYLTLPYITLHTYTRIVTYRYWTCPIYNDSIEVKFLPAAGSPFKPWTRRMELQQLQGWPLSSAPPP